jgi:hypothetical protein
MARASPPSLRAPASPTQPRRASHRRFTAGATFAVFTSGLGLALAVLHIVGPLTSPKLRR